MTDTDIDLKQIIAAQSKKFVREFSRVVMFLENALIPEDRIENTPSLADGLSRDVEDDLRILGCEMIQTAGILLNLPQVSMATGQVLYQRFFYSKSFVKHNYEIVAMACIALASKIEEAPRRVRDVANVFHHIKQIKNKKSINAMVLDTAYVELKNLVIKSERRILKELGFAVHVKHPHKIIVTFLQVLECEKNQRLIQCAWNYMNDSFRTNVFVRFTPESIAAACIYLAARQLKICLPNRPHWFLLFGIREENIRMICREILRLYTRSKPNVEELECDISELRNRLVETKLKEKQQRNNVIVAEQDSGKSNVDDADKMVTTADNSPVASGNDDYKKMDAGKKRDRSHSSTPPTNLKKSKTQSLQQNRSSSSSNGSAHQQDNKSSKTLNSASAIAKQVHDKYLSQQQQQQQHKKSPSGRHSSSTNNYRQHTHRHRSDKYDKYRVDKLDDVVKIEKGKSKGGNNDKKVGDGKDRVGDKYLQLVTTSSSLSYLESTNQQRKELQQRVQSEKDLRAKLEEKQLNREKDKNKKSKIQKEDGRTEIKLISGYNRLDYRAVVAAERVVIGSKSSVRLSQDSESIELYSRREKSHKSKRELKENGRLVKNEETVKSRESKVKRSREEDSYSTEVTQFVKSNREAVDKRNGYELLKNKNSYDKHRGRSDYDIEADTHRNRNSFINSKSNPDFKRIVTDYVVDLTDDTKVVKKEKSTDCDSALIPLICVHG